MRVPKLLLVSFLHVLAGSALGACHSTAPDAPHSPLKLEPAPPPPPAWTTAFLREAVLVADEIVIEGPPELVDHVALRLDEEFAVYSSKTVTTGLLQELVARPGMGVEVRAQLDGWAIAALRKITVLQRPGEVPVTVRAAGHAYWALADGSDERREDQLVFRGLSGQGLSGQDLSGR